MEKENDNTQNEELECKWYYRPFWVWSFILLVGPFALPLLILSPKFTKTTKYIISFLVLFFSIYFIYSSYQVYQMVVDPNKLKVMLQKYLTPEQMKQFDMLLDLTKELKKS